MLIRVHDKFNINVFYNTIKELSNEIIFKKINLNQLNNTIMCHTAKMASNGPKRKEHFI